MEKINITDLKRRKFNSYYITVYIVCKDIKIRSESCITNKTLYVLFGLDIMGNRQMLGIYFNDENNSRFWLETLEDFKARNLQQILFFVTTPNKNIERAVKIVYNDVHIIHSPDAIFHNITRFMADHPSRKLKIALKDLFLAENYDRYKVNVEVFKDIYVDNYIILKLLDKSQRDIETFYQYPQYLRELFYPFYAIHEMKKFLNKLKTKEPLCINLNDVIEFCLPYINSFENGRSYSKQKWLELVNYLYEDYPDKLEEYLNG